MSSDEERTTARAFVFPQGSAAPKGLLCDEILINYLIYFDAITLILILFSSMTQE